MKRLTAFIMLITFSISMNIHICYAQNDKSYDKMELMIEGALEDSDPTDGSPWNRESPSAFKWSYINGCMISAIMDIYDIKGDSRYLDFANTYMGHFMGTTNNSKTGYINSKTGFDYTKYTLDDLNSGKALIALTTANASNSSKFKKAVSQTLYTDILQYIVKNQKTAENSLWHKKSYPYQVWLDGIYMETPFWLEYELEIGNDKDKFMYAADHVVNQIKNVYDKLRDPATGLYYHGYDAQADKTSGSYDRSNAQSWAEKDTGHSANFWLRGTGWYAMALTDDIDIMTRAEKKFGIDLTDKKEYIAKIYTELMDSLLKYQDSSTKLWYQVIDKGSQQYNYIETSGSAAIAYSLMKGCNIGIADESYYNKGLEVFNSLYENKIVYKDDTHVKVIDICQTAGLGGSSSSAVSGPRHTSRDGSYEYYVSEKKVDDDAKGMAPIIFAYCEILRHKIPGDVDMNGSLEQKDAYIILKHISGIEPLTENAAEYADYNKDGSTDLKDVAEILKAVK